MKIGLIGFKQIGKSTAAAYLEETHGFVRHNFKDALVAEMRRNLWDHMVEIGYAEYARKNFLIADNETEESIVDRLFEEKPPLFRSLMQNYGTDVRRYDDPNYWVKQWVAPLYNTKDLVTDDVRFLNEAAAVKGQGGVLIRLTRPDVQSGGTHKSETEQLKIVADYTIDCEQGNHKKLYEELDKIVAELKK